jgi:hypothetical protein
MRVVARLRLDQDGVRPAFADRGRAAHDAAHHVQQRPHERALVGALFVPVALAGRERRRDVRLVDRREVADPPIALDEGGDIRDEPLGDGRVLVVANVVRDAEVHQVGDRDEAG